MSDRPPFHLAFPVDDLTAAREFYGQLLGCPEGRSAETWVDFDLYGHQIVAHYRDDSALDAPTSAHRNRVDGHDVPVPHFGVVLKWDDWQQLEQRLHQANVEFIVAPHIRFAGSVGEQATMFLADPAGNALEFKAFRDPSQLFAK